MTEVKHNKRAGTRFPAPANTLIYVKINDNHEYIGLAYSQSYHGCGGVFSSKIEVQEKQLCHVKVGELNFLKAEVRHISNLDSDFIKIGFKLLE